MLCYLLCRQSRCKITPNDCFLNFETVNQTMKPVSVDHMPKTNALRPIIITDNGLTTFDWSLHCSDVIGYIGDMKTCMFTCL